MWKRSSLATKTPFFSSTKLRDDPVVQTEIAHAEALWQGLHAFLMATAREAWQAHRAGSGAIDKNLRARLRLASTHAMRESARVVDRVYDLGGTDVIFGEHPLQRCFQDIHALSQQVQGRPNHYRAVGQQLLGLDPDSMFL